MVKIALVSSRNHLSFVEDAMKEAMPDADVFLWPADGWRDAEIAVSWAPPPGELAKMPRLRMIHSSGVGVDNILSDPDLPAVPVCRIVDPTVTQGMLEFVLWSVLYFHRRFDVVLSNARTSTWARLKQPRTSQCRITILGLGEIGARIAAQLSQLGFPVTGWSRSPKSITGVDVLHGADGLEQSVSSADILVCLLPLTAETQGILDRKLLARLPRGAALIQCARGEHLMIDDLVALLRDGHIRGAVVDVFEQEPLAADDLLWSVPGLLVTPHMAALAKPETIAAKVAENVERLVAGEPLIGQVDPGRGY